MNSKIKKICSICNNEFFSYESQKRIFCSRKCLGKWQSTNRIGKDHPAFKGGKGRCVDCKKELSNYRAIRCKSCNVKYLHKTGRLNNIGANSSFYKDGRSLKIYFCKCGKEICLNNALYGSKMCHSCAFKKENHWNWLGGISKLPYSFEFDTELKESIRRRDNYECQNCGMTEEEQLIVLGQTLTIHHIDYEKTNCKETNLITTCLSCNIRANFNRDYWQTFYTQKMEKIEC